MAGKHVKPHVDFDDWAVRRGAARRPQPFRPVKHRGPAGNAEESHRRGILRLAATLYDHVYGGYFVELDVDDDLRKDYIMDAIELAERMPHLLNAAERGLVP